VRQEHTRQRRRRGRRRGATVLRVVLGLLLAGILFALGVGLGRALEQNPRPIGERTSVRTLRPVPLTAEPVTVTVTVTAPDS